MKLRLQISFLCHVVALTLCRAEAFQIVSWRPPETSVSVERQTMQKMCICIDCARVTNCAAYYFVETKHEQPHVTDEPTFMPRDGNPTIHVNVRTVRSSSIFGQIRSEHERETTRAIQSVELTPTAGNNIHGETVYDLAPVTTSEYDVVKCADFVSDPGCWVRNMPEEIRLANPDFVPT